MRRNKGVWALLKNKSPVNEKCILFSSAKENFSPLVTIGRHPSSNLVLNDPHVSSKHAILEHILSATSADANQVFITDLSSNGTWLNGALMKKGERVELRHGDELTWPSDDEEDKREYQFTFTILPPQEEGGGATIAASSATRDTAGGAASSSLSSSSTRNPLAGANSSSSVMNSSPEEEGEENMALESMTQWLTLQDQCDLISRETARVAASVYATSDRLREMLERASSSSASFASSSSSSSAGSSSRTLPTVSPRSGEGPLTSALRGPGEEEEERDNDDQGALLREAKGLIQQFLLLESGGSTASPDLSQRCRDFLARATTSF